MKKKTTKKKPAVKTQAIPTVISDLIEQYAALERILHDLRTRVAVLEARPQQWTYSDPFQKRHYLLHPPWNDGAIPDPFKTSPPTPPWQAKKICCSGTRGPGEAA